jgi:hypothetical protein
MEDINVFKVVKKELNILLVCDVLYISNITSLSYVNDEGIRIV